MFCLEPRAVAGYFPDMRTAAFILFAVVTAAAAALSTLVASRYFSMEKDVADVRSQLEDARRELKRQEADKTSLLLERQRIQGDLEARFAEERAQLEECGNQRQQEFQEILNNLVNLQKRITDAQTQAAPTAAVDQSLTARGDKGSPGDGTAAAPGASAPSKDAVVQPSVKPQATDVRRGAVPTPEQEAKTLDKAQ
jgi:septal ring factor EnvC (AmiA/AmiB activator)